MTQITGYSITAGRISKNGQATFQGMNPRTSTLTEWTFYEATAEDVEAAVEAAAEAFRTTRNKTAEQRAQLLDQIAAEIEALGDDLLNTADAETGLGLPRLTGERGRTTGQLRKFAQYIREGSYVEAIIDTALPERQPAPRPDIRRMLIPIGVVAVFTPNNFPFAFGAAGGDTASALAVGCPVILKAHPTYPATCELVAHAINRAVTACGFPPGTFSVLQGAGIEIGQALIKHPKLDAVAFTGSFKGGRAIFDTAAARERPIPVFAEMGSINPVLILPSAIQSRGETLAKELVASVTLGTGQFCTNPGLILVQKGVETETFIQQVTQLMQEAQPGVLLNEGVQKGLKQAVGATSGHAQVDLRTGGHMVASEAICYANTVMQTTGQAFIKDESLQTEHFGPVTLFVVCDSLDKMRAAIAAVEGNLTATVHAEADEYAQAGELFDLLKEKAGRLLLNGFPTGVEVVYSMVHGGPYPATTAPGTTSVGMTAARRFLRPVAYQNLPDALLPDALKDGNPLGILRLVDEQYTREPIA